MASRPLHEQKLLTLWFSSILSQKMHLRWKHTEKPSNVLEKVSLVPVLEWVAAGSILG